VGTVVFYLCVAYLRNPKEKKLEGGDIIATEIDQKAHGMELAIRNSERNVNIVSPDGTDSIITTSDVSSMVSSVGGNNNRSAARYANHLLLPGTPGGDNRLVSRDGQEGALADIGAIEEGVAVRSPVTVTRMSDASTLAVNNTTGGALAMSNVSYRGQNNLNAAIESGNWEAVANSAAAIIRQNGSDLSSVVTEID